MTRRDPHSKPGRRYNRASYAAWLLATLIVLASAPVLLLSLEFDSLPTAQGWDYFLVGNSVPETDVYSVDGGILHQNSMGVGFQGQGSNLYQLPDAVDTGLDCFSLEIEARVLESANNPNNYFGFSFGLNLGVEIFGIGLGTSEVADIHNVTILTGQDNTQWHTYRLDGEFGGEYVFYIDEVQRATGETRILEPPETNRLFFGDATGGANARADIRAFEFSQNDCGATSLEDDASGRVRLLDVSPNPFEHEAVVRLEVPVQTHVRPVVYDARGRQVLTLVDAERAPGLYDVPFDARRLPSGTYVVRLTTPDGETVRTVQHVGR